MERRTNLLEVVRYVTVVSFLVSLAMVIMTIIDHGSPRLVAASVISLAIMVIVMAYWVVCDDALKKYGGGPSIQPSKPPKTLSPEEIDILQKLDELPVLGGPMPPFSDRKEVNAMRDALPPAQEAKVETYEEHCRRPLTTEEHQAKISAMIDGPGNKNVGIRPGQLPDYRIRTPRTISP